MSTKPDRFGKLTAVMAHAPLTPLVAVPAPAQPVPAPVKALVARLSVSLPPAEAECIEVLAKESARATGDKPTVSEVVRAGLMLLAALPPAERLAAIGRVPKVR